MEPSNDGDRVRKDLKQFRIEESSWYHEAQDRDQ